MDTPEGKVRRAPQVPRLPLNFGPRVEGQVSARGGSGTGKTPRSGNPSGKTPRSSRGVAAEGGAHPTDAHSSRGRATGAAGFIDDFMKRGTPRQSAPPGSSCGGFSQRRLEQLLAAWTPARGLPPLTARALSVIAHDAGVLLTARGSSIEDTSVLHEASILFSGVEVLVTISLSSPSAGPRVTGGAFSARAPEPKLVSAQSHCAWPAAQQRLVSAVEVASGRSLEEFLDALWADGVPWRGGASNDGVAVASPDLARTLAPFGTPTHIAEEDEELDDSSSEEEASTPSPSAAVANPAASQRSFEEAMEAVEPLPPDSSCWDWPLSRHEKKHRIVLLERQMHEMDRQTLIRDLLKEQRRNSVCCSTLRD